ncbi:MAG: amidase [Tistlia sp.]|uniref:amidase n=1 Tax=Tistlia sp. TaxID=3057121 RepID=UPI0034A36FF9
MSPSLPFLSIQQLSALYRTREVSPVEVTRQLLERISALNPQINAFVATTENRAQAAAAASEMRWRQGAPLGPLDGVPITVKDTLMVEGEPFRRGSRATSSAPVAESAPVVDRVLEQGAVLLGITTTPEFGAGPITISPLTGITRNPWDTGMNSGGSSGGAAASVAAGLCYAGLATDAGGSIRIPANFCGAVGLKATGGRVPTYPPNVAGALAVPGAITRDVADAALMLAVLAQPDARDAELAAPTQDNWLAAPAGGLKGCRVAVTTDLGYAEQVDPEVAGAVRRAAQVIAGLGAEVVEADPGVVDPIETFNTLFRSGFAYALRSFGPEQLALVGEQLRDAARRGAAIDLNTYLEAQDQRRALGRAFARFFQDYDLLLTPTTSVTAFAADRWVPESFEDRADPRAWTPFGYPVNLAQCPAITLPCGFSKAGLPIGLQIVGPRFGEATVLALAQAYEKARGIEVGAPPQFE